jgi:hypothetical protein
MTDTKLTRASPGNGNRLVATLLVLAAAATAIIFAWLWDQNGSMRDLRDRVARLEGAVSSMRENQQANVDSFQREYEKEVAAHEQMWTAIRGIESAQARIPLEEFLRRFNALEKGMQAMQHDITGLKMDMAKIAALLEKGQSGKDGGG